MRANELRIGNWLHFDNFIGNSHYIQVTPRMFRNMGLDCSDNLEIELNQYYEPIPLTEEMLLKCGFHKELDAFYRKNKSQMIEVCFHDDGILITNQSVCLSSIKYLHQIQNLFFALTNEELNIEL